MITSIEGTLSSSSPVQVVVDVNGLGYEVHVPVTTSEKLPASGKRVKLYTHVVYREDSQALYGFYAQADRDFFRLLVEKVSGIGPKVALSILSKLPLEIIRGAIARGDAALLAKCPGIGKKTAERLVIELRDRVNAMGGADGPSTADLAGAGESPRAGEGISRHQDAVMALLALGYKAAEADKAVRQAATKLGGDASVEELIKKALG